MANRPVFKVNNKRPYFEEINIDFVYYKGFSVTQKQKSIDSLHNEYLLKYPKSKVLEVSTKSKDELGRRLSAFNLMFNSDVYLGKYNLENIFQSSKVFENGGPYKDLLYVSPKDAKRDERLVSSGKLLRFEYGDHVFMLEPKTAFYDWIYITALSGDKELSKDILEYDAFTDIEFNPNRSINCQARAAAIFVSLSKEKILEETIKDFNSIKDIYL